MRTVTLYYFEELSPEAKKKAIDRAQEKLYYLLVPDASEIEEIFQGLLAENGLPLDDIRWSLSCCQGDGVAFYGDVDLEKLLSHFESIGMLLGSERQYARLRKAGIIDDLSCRLTKVNHHYDHYNSMGIQTSFDALRAWPRIHALLVNLEEMLEEYIKDVSRDLEEKGYDIYQSATSPEATEEFLIANEVEFREDGSLY